MKRLFWMSVGAVVGVVAVRKVSERAKDYTPTGLAAQVLERLEDIGDGLLELADAVRDGMSERESELREALGLASPSEMGTQPHLTSAQARAVIADPVRARAR